VQAFVYVPSLLACWNTGVRMPWEYVIYHTIVRRDSVVSIDMPILYYVLSYILCMRG
jgi:hypothetical protein